MNFPGHLSGKRFFFQVLILACTQPSGFGQTSSDALTWVQAKMREYLGHLPNYTCRVTLERLSRKRQNQAFEVNDRLRLEVAFAGGQELYSWPGDNRFEFGLEKLVGIPGMISTGSYALLTRDLFTSSAAEFSSIGEADCAGSPCAEVNFKVPIERTRYIISDGDGRGLAPYSGSIWFDRDTLELRQVRVHTDQTPQAMKIAALQETTVYGRVRVGDSDAVLPRSTETVSTRRDGSQNRNLATFENYHRYAGQSTISFDDAPQRDAPVQASHEVQVPASFDVEMALDAPIGSEAAIGDLVTASIRRISSKQPSNIPVRARVICRITNLGWVGSLPLPNSGEFATYNSWFLSIKPLRIEWEGGQASISGSLRSITEGPPVSLIQRPASKWVEPVLAGFGFSTAANALRVTAAQLKIPAGFRMTWRAQPAPK